MTLSVASAEELAKRKEGVDAHGPVPDILRAPVPEALELAAVPVALAAWFRGRRVRRGSGGRPGLIRRIGGWEIFDGRNAESLRRGPARRRRAAGGEVGGEVVRF